MTTISILPYRDANGNKITPDDVVWTATPADEMQALANHLQTLARLQERGGVSWCELCAILAHQPYQAMNDAVAKLRVLLILSQR